MSFMHPSSNPVLVTLTFFESLANGRTSNARKLKESQEPLHGPILDGLFPGDFQEGVIIRVLGDKSYVFLPNS